MDRRVTSMLDRTIYSYGDVDCLVGLRPGTSGRWLEGYARSGRFYDPVLREKPTGGESVTGGEMVEARLLAEFRSRDVSVQRVPAFIWDSHCWMRRSSALLPVLMPSPLRQARRYLTLYPESSMFGA